MRTLAASADRAQDRENTSRAALILVLALISVIVYAALATRGDLRETLPLYYAGHVVLLGCMFLAWRHLRGSRRGMRWVLVAALAFRLVAALGPPALSDDVYRYVWDGRVQLHGIHPYRHAPDSPELAGLRDDTWSRINHPELKTIYPPLAQILFAVLAGGGAGPSGFKLVMGMLDFGVVLALGFLLRRLRLPRDRLILYAWNPLAVIEAAGSGHVEPLGVGLVLLAAAWIIDRRPGLSTLALVGAVHAKIIPLLLVPGHARRRWPWGAAVLAIALMLPFLPYAVWGGPIVGAGLFDFAERFEHNAFVYAGVEQGMVWLDTGPRLTAWIGAARSRLGEAWIPWELLYRYVWPREVARGLVLLVLGAWIGWVVFRARRDAARESFLVLAGMLLLAPTLHPWYVLWVLPFAAAFVSRGWLVFAMLVPLAYLGGGAGVPWLARCAEYLPLLALVIFDTTRGRRGVGGFW